MLSFIKVRNFTCFDDHSYEIKFSKLTLVVGPNNSGKSAIFKALNFIRYYSNFSLSVPISWSTDYYDLQSDEMVFHNHDKSKNLDISVGYTKNDHTYEAKFEYDANNILINKFLRDGNYISDLRNLEHFQLASDILYISSNRGLIPYQIEVGRKQSDVFQPIHPNCDNTTQFLLEKFNEQSPDWPEFEKWMKKIDPQINIFKTNLDRIYTSLATERKDDQIVTKVNLSLQGSGIQSVVSIVAAVILSKPNSTIIIEEPENFLHAKTIETLVDLFNHAVNDLSKQIIIITHSWNILKQYISDVGPGTPRGNDHVKIKPEYFTLTTVDSSSGQNKILQYDISHANFNQVISDFKTLWG